MRFRSIVARILVLHIVVIGTASVLIPAALYLLLVSETNQLHQQAMQRQADQIAEHLGIGADGRPTLSLPQSLRDLYSEAYGRSAYSVLDADGTVLFSSHRDRARLFPEETRTDEPRFVDRLIDGVELFGAVIPKQVAGHRLWVEVAEDLSHRDVLLDDVVRDFFKRVAWITLPLLLVVLGVDVEIVRRAFRPVLQASHQAADISPSRPGLRLPLASIPNEIRPLVTAVNEALDRLEHGYRVQREFAADAAHELRTPLAILRARIDTLADKSATQLLCKDVDSMSRTVNQLLEMAEAESFVVGPQETADLHQAAAETVAFLAPLALAQAKSIALTGADHQVRVAGNSEMIGRAIRNLVENAIKHSPQGGAIEVVVEDNGTVRVLDEGPGVSSKESRHIFDRFWRRDRRGGNFGLGLSIVQRIMEAHGGSAAVQWRSQGGAEFILTFRLAEPAPQAGAPGDPSVSFRS